VDRNDECRVMNSVKNQNNFSNPIRKQQSWKELIRGFDVRRNVKESNPAGNINVKLHAAEDGVNHIMRVIFVVKYAINHWDVVVIDVLPFVIAVNAIHVVLPIVTEWNVHAVMYMFRVLSSAVRNQYPNALRHAIKYWIVVIDVLHSVTTVTVHRVFVSAVNHVIPTNEWCIICHVM